MCKCQPGHLFINCSVVKDTTGRLLLLVERHQIIKDLHRCFICFSAHKFSDCKNQRKCSECGGRHHTLLYIRQAKDIITAAHVTVTPSETKDLRTSK